MDRLVVRHRQQEREDTLRTGMIGSILLNIYRKPGAQAVRPEDFLPVPIRAHEKPTPKQVREYLIAMARAHNATLKKPN